MSEPEFYVGFISELYDDIVYRDEVADELALLLDYDLSR